MSKRAEEAALKAYPHFTAENITEVVEKDAELGPGKNCWQ